MFQVLQVVDDSVKLLATWSEHKGVDSSFSSGMQKKAKPPSHDI